MVEFFLWLSLILRVCIRLAPYILGVVGATLIIHYIRPGIPSGYGPLLFIVIAIGLICGLKNNDSGE